MLHMDLNRPLTDLPGTTNQELEPEQFWNMNASKQSSDDSIAE